MLPIKKRKESMTNMPNSFDDDTDLWETRQLGASEEYVRVVSPAKTKAVHESLGLQPITIRLQKELVDELKTLAKKEGLGYQPFIRHVLTKYIQGTQPSPNGAYLGIYLAGQDIAMAACSIYSISATCTSNYIQISRDYA
jgi:predicted DNA binding CopG/RHH family protein